MRVGIATDHGGFSLKADLVAQLRAAGHDVVDFGADTLNPDDDYPDFVVPLAEAVAADTVERGVAVCGSGVGASICANKIPGVRAALIHDHFSAGQGVEDDHMNIIALVAAPWARASPGSSCRLSWPPSTAKPRDTCAA
jgi:ribose 5-phosphate isomerase B